MTHVLGPDFLALQVRDLHGAAAFYEETLGMERAEIEMAVAMLATGRVATAPMITHTMGIDDLPKAFASLALPTNQSKVIVEF